MFLQALERGDKLVRVDRLDISRSARGDEKEAETLSIVATIAGFAVNESIATASSKQPARAARPGERRRALPMSARAWTERRRRSQSRSCALGVRVVDDGVGVVRALRVDALPDVRRTTLASLESISARRRSAPPTDIQAAVENDLFSADRSAPAAPYRMPGEHAPDDKPVVEPMKPIVLGTAVATDGRSFATVQLGDATSDARSCR